MSRRWPLAALIVAWALATVTIFLAGRHMGETDSDGPRYSQCKPIDWAGRIGLLCFEETAPEPVTNEGEA